MLIPKYWAHYKQRFDAKTEFDNAKKQATIKRYGWSDKSQNDALLHAKARVADTHNRWLAGEDIIRRERKEQYNEANGIPIREQIISERSLPEHNPVHTQLIVTRNSYGAQVANVDNIAIIDIDTIDLFWHLYPNGYFVDSFAGIEPDTSIPQKSSAMKRQVWGFVIVSIIIASVIAWQSLSWLWLIGVMLLGTALLWRQASQNEQAQQQAKQQKMAEILPFMTELIQKRVSNHPNEQFRLYETPAGFRLIATHATILPSDEVVAEWFTYFNADANYARLCAVQQCFRARVTAKPWRMTEVTEQHKLSKEIPNKDFWFTQIDDNTESLDELDDEQYAHFEKQQVNVAARQQWIKDYDNFAQNYKACRFMQSFGSQKSNNSANQIAINEFVDWHDKACQIDKDLPMG